ncbi:MAG: cation:proton antiporter [Pseudomonadota bacterium]
MELGLALLTAGALLLAGLAADAVGRRVHVPRVTLIILIGVVLGRPGLDLLPAEILDLHETLAIAALTMVAFALGGELTAETLRRHGRVILSMSVAVALISAACVVIGLTALGAPLPIALALGGVATATAPAATRDVVRESGATGPFATRLLGIVAIDDAWGLIAFGFLLSAAAAIGGNGAADIVGSAALELGGSVVLGLVIGAPAAALTGRLRPGEPTRIEVLGVVLICAGLAVMLGLSFLLAGMTAGVVVANFARHHERPFREIDNLQGPFLILFFVVAGATLTPEALGAAAPLAAAFAVLRAAGRLLGGFAGATAAGLSMREGRWTGAAMMPQAGVALGMALVAGDHLPEHRDTLVAVTVASTIIFELAGPFATQWALRQAEREAAA